MIKDIQTASFFLKDGLNDNSSFRWCFCPGDEGGPSGNESAGSGGYGGVADEDIGSGVDTTGIDVDALSTDLPGMTVEEYEAVEAAEQAARAQTQALGLSPEDITSLYTGMLEDPMNFDFSPKDDYINRKLKKSILYPKKLNASAIGKDPAFMKLGKTPELLDRQRTYLSMLAEAGKEAADYEEKNKDEFGINKQPLTSYIQTELNKGRFADSIASIEDMNKLENAGFKTFGTGYRGEYEARAPNALSREEYDPVTLMASGTGPRSGTLSLFSQFAKENPAMTAMEALSAFNAVGSFGTLSEADLGMLGYSPNQAVGPQAAFTENTREEGFYQGLGMLGRAALGPTSAIGVLSDIMASPNPSMVSSILAGLNDATKGDTGVGIVDEVNQITDPISKAFDTAATDLGNFVDSNVNSFFDFFSPEEETTYNSAIGMADPAFQGRAGVSYTGSPFSGLPADTVDNYTNALAGLEEAERAEAISGVPADPSMGLADPAFAVQGQLQPGSFFSGLTPEQVESYVNTVSTPESTRRYVERRNTPYPMQPTTSIESDPFMPVSEQTSSFFPEVDLPNNSRFFELANIYGPERAQQLLGLA